MTYLDRTSTAGRKNILLVSLLHAVLCFVPAQTNHFTEKEIIFYNGPVALSGTSIMPAKDGKFPVVIFLHGSGPATRKGARPYAIEFAKMGIASIIYDKRGSGNSGGSWMTSSLDDLANDALAAVKFSSSLTNVDTGKIGVWGVSQAGWVATLAASQSSSISFMIIISGGGASPLESEMFSYSAKLKKGNCMPAESEEAFQLLDLYFTYLSNGKNRDALMKEIEASRSKSWYRYISLDNIIPSESNYRNWSWVSTWDPVPHISAISCPMLLLFGSDDEDHPTERSVQQWRMALEKGLNPKATIVVFPGAGHGLRIKMNGAGKAKGSFVDGYSEVMLGWLWQHVVSPR